MKDFICDDCNLERLLENFRGTSFEESEVVLTSLSELNQKDIENYVKVKGLDVLKKGGEAFAQAANVVLIGGLALNYPKEELDWPDYLIIGVLGTGGLISAGASLLFKNDIKELSEKLEKLHSFEWKTFIREKKGLYQLTTESIKDPKDNSVGINQEKVDQKLEEGKKWMSYDFHLENGRCDDIYVLVNGVLVTECEQEKEIADVINFKTGTKQEEQSYSTRLKVVTKDKIGLKTADAYLKAPTNELLGKDRSLVGKELWMACKYEGDKIRVVDYGPAITK